MAKLDLHAHVEAPIDPLWDVVTRLDEKGLGSLGIHPIETSSGELRMEDGMSARLRLAIKVSRFTIGGLVTVRVVDFDEEHHRFGVNILNAPDGVRGNVGVALTESDDRTNLRFHGNLKLPFKAELAFPLIHPIIESQVMPHVGGKLAAKALRRGD